MERREQDPEEKLRREAFERSDESGAMVTRRLLSKRFRNSLERESREALELLISKVLDPMLEDRFSVDVLKKFKEIGLRKYGHPLSTPHLSASVIHDIGDELYIEATEYFKNSEISSIPIDSILSYDTSVGIILVTSTITDAENAIRGISDNELGYAIFDRLAEEIGLSESADFYFRKKAKILKHSELLKEDPTGKSLIRYAVEEMENPQEELAPCLKALVVHGARFAQKAYGIVYPLAEKINQPT